MKSKSEDWVHLAAACEHARVELRTIEARCHLALEAGADPVGTLRYVCEAAGRRAAAITAALKDRQARQNRNSARFQPLWAAAEASGGGRDHNLRTGGSRHEN